MGGSQCQFNNATLAVNIISAITVQDADPDLPLVFIPITDRSDPFVRVVATDSDGNTRTKETTHKSGTHTPTWREVLDFGMDTWTNFTIQVWDEDAISANDPLSDIETVDFDNEHVNPATRAYHDCYEDEYICVTIYEYSFA